MLVTDITVDDFKEYFTREFNYLNYWTASNTYKKDEIVYYGANTYFYQSLQKGNKNKNPSTETEYWEEIEDSVNNYVDDPDIEKAMGQATADFNTNLFSDNDNTFEIAYLLLTAHYLVCDLNMANGNGASSFIMNSKSVDGVSASYSIPQSLINNPNFSYLAKTEFGLKYLHLLSPRLNGYFYIVNGTTSFR